MNPSKIEWTEKVANPIKTKCRHKCSWNNQIYCYMYCKNFYNRFGFYQDELKLDLDCLKAPRIRNQTIFIGSGTDIFGKWIPNDYIESILQELRKLHKSNTIIFLTKNMKRYLDFNFQENMICGVTIETDIIFTKYYSEAGFPSDRLYKLIDVIEFELRCKNILISVEPILRFSPFFIFNLFKIKNLKFIILGFNTSKIEMEYPSEMAIQTFLKTFEELKIETNRNIQLLIKPNLGEYYQIPSHCYPIKLGEP